MNLHCIGDSHCSFFLGYNIIPKEYPFIAKSLHENIFCYRLGASLAYSINKFETSIKSREKLELIVSKLNPQKDIIILSFGEIDCRAHILKQAFLKNVDSTVIVKSCIKNYLEIIDFIEAKKFKIIIWNAIYSANSVFNNEDLEFPFFGKVEERNRVTKEFNTELSFKLLSRSSYFLTISDLIIDKMTGFTLDTFYFDVIHLNNKLFLHALTEINNLLNIGIFNKADRIKYQIRLFFLENSIKTQLKAYYFAKKLKLYISNGKK